ncbi:hypothetical protein Trydic_g17118 [Trypoxylus dichotomus]
MFSVKRLRKNGRVAPDSDEESSSDSSIASTKSLIAMVTKINALEDTKDYKKFLATFKDVLPFYTFTPRSEKTHVFMIKGLHADASCGEVRDELQELRVCVKKLTGVGKPEFPMLLLITDNNGCKKCQTWGHATQNCYSNVTICVKCAEMHASYNCEKSRDTPARYCSCGLDHSASSTQCKVYLDLLEDRRERQQHRRSSSQTRVQASTAANKECLGDALPTATCDEFPPSPASRLSHDPHYSSTKIASSQRENPVANNEDLKNLRDISATLSGINKIVNLKWLAEKMRKLHEQLKQGKSLMVYIMAISEFSEATTIHGA